MSKYLIFAILLTGCYTRPVAVRQHGRAAATYPDIAADYCARVYPVVPKIVKGDSIVVVDTLWEQGETFIDTVYSLDTIRITKVVKLPGTVITRTVTIHDTVVVENTAALDIARSNERTANSNLAAEQLAKKKYQDRSRKYLWILIAIGGIGALWLFFRLRKPK